METQKTLNTQINVEKEKESVINLPDFRLYYKTTIIKILIYGAGTETDQRNRTVSPDINPCTCGHLIYGK